MLELAIVVKKYMKKVNNKYRNNNNQIYSLNYKFDSISIAGKFSGTALDLIKKYNELAKEAHSNNDYVNAEVFRQYAEHYRKIVTEINEKKNQNQNNSPRNTYNKPEADNVDSQSSEKSEADAASNLDAYADSSANDDADNPLAEIKNSSAADCNVIDLFAERPADKPAEKAAEKKSFTIIEISPENSKSEVIENSAESEESKPHTRRYTRKKAV